MRLTRKPLFSFLCLLVLVNAHGVERFVSLGGGHVAPFTNWLTAATNIQAAIEATASGDIVTVTNGIYDNGGKVKAGDLTNRVALDKPILVRSVSGPNFTTIQGAWDSAATNGPGAVRCAWLTNGATLDGFTLRVGATRKSSNPYGASTNSGGGAWCASTGSLITNCLIWGNAAAYQGGGVFSNTVVNSTILGNTVGNNGGGTYGAVLKNCALVGNRVSASAGYGGGAYNGALTNCTVAGNVASSGGGVCGGWATLVINSILWSNSSSTTGSNYSGSVTARYSCSLPIPTGTGNISSDPQLIIDGVHLAASSSCRGAGNALYVTGWDIDSQSWSNPPSMGCDEWIAAPTMTSRPKIMHGPMGQLQISTLPAAGQDPIAYSWLRDGAAFAGARYSGVETTRLLINNFGPQDAGGYQIIASNAVGMATSAVAQVTVRCVNVVGVSPTEPYADWTTAATNIQTAIDLAAIGDIVLVTNGVYGSGGKVKAGDLTNRIALDKALIVMSVNGAANTAIVGTPGRGGVNSFTTPNGTNAVRCAWLADGAILSGFTLQGGGTRVSTTTLGSATNSGGGVWCASQGALVLQQVRF